MLLFAVLLMLFCFVAAYCCRSAMKRGLSVFTFISWTLFFYDHISLCQHFHSIFTTLEKKKRIYWPHLIGIAQQWAWEQSRRPRNEQFTTLGWQWLQKYVWRERNENDWSTLRCLYLPGQLLLLLTRMMDDNAGEGDVGDDGWWMMMAVIMVMMVTFLVPGCMALWCWVSEHRPSFHTSYRYRCTTPTATMASSVLIMSTSLHTHVVTLINTSHTCINSKLGQSISKVLEENLHTLYFFLLCPCFLHLRFQNQSSENLTPLLQLSLPLLRLI